MLVLRPALSRAALGVIAAGFVACGASPRMMLQSNTYYEQCQSAELNPSRTLEERDACWTAWLTHYTASQPIERVAYARERRVALAHGEEIAPLPDREDRAYEIRGVSRASTASVESEPPPPEIAVDDRDSTSESRSDPDEGVFRQDQGAPAGRHFPVRRIAPASDAPPLSPPREYSDGACGVVCNPRWDRCTEQCGGRPGACHAACEVRYRQCMAACS